MPGRDTTIGSSHQYRFGFNGKEVDNDTYAGHGNEYDYGFRIYNPRIGRFLSVDPLFQSYPWYTPYQFAGNKPIWGTDVDGLEENTTSTYTKKPTIPRSFKLTFRGIISITDATAHTANKIFEGNFVQLTKADPTGLAPSIATQLIGSTTGTARSRLEITMTGTKSVVSKSWVGTDIKYYTQYSYSFSSNNVSEIGTFEVNSSSTKASARAWDPLVFLLMNKVVSSIVIANLNNTVGTATSEEMITLYRSISKEEAQSIEATKRLSFKEGQMEVKQFWQTEEGLTNFNSTKFRGEYNLEITVPKSLLGEGKVLNTAIQPDESLGSTATVDGAADLNSLNESIQSFKITPIKK